MAEVASLIVSVESKGIKQATDALQRLGQESEETARSTKSLKDQTEKLISQFVLEGRAVNKTADEIKLLKLEQAGATKAQLQAAKAALEYKNNLIQQAQAADQAAREQEELSNQSNVVRGNFGAAKNATQQLSFQLQDVAVQAQSGTSAFVILGQQGPQLASIFGSGGAVAGAVIAFSALIGGVLASTLFGASESMEEMGDRAKNLAKEFDELTEAQQRAVTGTLQGQLRLLNEEIEKQEGIVANAKARVDQYAESIEQMFVAEEFTELNDEYNNQVNILTELTQKQNELKDAIKGVKPEITDLISGLKEESVLFGLVGRQRDLEIARLKNATPEQISEINRLYDLIEAKQKEEEKRKKNKEALAAEAKERDRANQAIDREIQRQETLAARRLDAAMQAGMSPIERMRDNLEAQLELLEQDRLAATVAAEQKGQDILAIEMMYDQARINLTEQTESQITQIITREEQLREQIRLAAEQMAIARAQATAGQLTSITKQAFGEQSAAAKAMFALQQALAMAQIIVSTEQAAVTAAAQSSVLGGLAGFLSTQAAIRAMGAISLGIVAGQTIAGLTGRALGGQVRGGQSYIVGERGPELLTMGTSGRIASNDQLRTAMRETESSNNNMVTVNFAIQANDTQGFDRLLQSRRGQIVTMMQQAFSEKGRKLLA
jgi:hypothetical protein